MSTTDVELSEGQQTSFSQDQRDIRDWVHIFERTPEIQRLGIARAISGLQIR